MRTASRRDTTRLYGSGGRGPLAELLLPPLGLAALDLGLRLRDVLAELALLVREPLLELSQRLLALLELVGADLDVRRELGLAQVELALALVELLVPIVQRLLEVAQARLLAIGALPVRLGDRLEVLDLGLARGQLLLALLQPRRPLLEVAAAVRVRARRGRSRPGAGSAPPPWRLTRAPAGRGCRLPRPLRCVVKVASDLRPWGMAACRGARTVLELGAGEAARRGLKPGVSLTQVWRSVPGSSPARPPAPASPRPS
jgi:hypothetical protein